MQPKQYIYELEFKVRDYECDFLGIVNNAVYLNYLEHTRHEFMRSIGIDFVKMHDEGNDAVVTRVEMDYKFPLRSSDSFLVCLNLERAGQLRLVFLQDIFRLPDRKLILKAEITGVCLQNGKPVVSDEILKHFSN